MDVDEARTLALAKLREIENPDYPLALDGAQQVAERSWCWIFPFDSVRYLETRRFLDSVVSGPIVVNKDGTDTWVPGTSDTLDEWLDEYARKAGYVPEA